MKKTRKASNLDVKVSSTVQNSLITVQVNSSSSRTRKRRPTPAAPHSPTKDTNNNKANESVPSKKPRVKESSVSTSGGQKAATSTSTSIGGVLYSLGTNIAGQLGFNADDVDSKIYPTVISSLHKQKIRFKSVESGGMHTVALTVDGKAYTFGCNDEGALGRNTEGDDEEEISATPTLVDLPGIVTQVTAGSCHTAFLTEEGHLYCCGTFRNANGKYGLRYIPPINGIEQEQPDMEKYPVRINIPLNEKIVQIASGNEHIAILTETGCLYTFGYSEDVIGRVYPKRTCRRTSSNIQSERHFNLTPQIVEIGSTRRFRQIWAGSSVTMCKENIRSGTIWVFGMNSQKQLGIRGNENYVIYPVRSRNITRCQFTKIAIGEFHCLGLDINGQVWSWGKPTESQLGLGDATPAEAIETPTLIPSLAKQKFINIGVGHSVSYAIAEDTSLFSWGFAENAQLGLPGDDDVRSPTPVLSSSGGYPVRAVNMISGGGQHTCLIGQYGLGKEVIRTKS